MINVMVRIALSMAYVIFIVENATVNSDSKEITAKSICAKKAIVNLVKFVIRIRENAYIMKMNKNSLLKLLGNQLQVTEVSLNMLLTEKIKLESKVVGVPIHRAVKMNGLKNN